MTRDRMFGSDTPFMDWMRRHRDLPSYSSDCGFVQTDCDTILHRYLTSVDNIGTREVQGIMHLEIKTRGGRPTTSQADTLFKLHQFSGAISVNSQHVQHFGVYFVSVSDTSPENSDVIEWGDFKKATYASQIRWTVIDRDLLISLLRFEVKPWPPFEKRPFRRRHKTQAIYLQERAPLGFETYRQVTKRS
jgi:hypothetical protein